jgi:hypothetical protein
VPSGAGSTAAMGGKLPVRLRRPTR